jgi:uncharacterized protein HemX
VEDAPAKNELHGTLLKWILGLMVAGISALAGWGGSQIKETNARANKAADDSTEYLKEMVKAEREELRTERTNNTKAVNELTTAVKGQTDFFGKMNQQLDTLIKDQRAGAWRASPIPEPRPE